MKIVDQSLEARKERISKGMEGIEDTGRIDYFEQPSNYTFNEVARLQEESRLTGRREVVEWLKEISEGNPAVGKLKIYPSEWARKLKEWGL